MKPAQLSPLEVGSLTIATHRNVSPSRDNAFGAISYRNPGPLTFLAVLLILLLGAGPSLRAAPDLYDFEALRVNNFIHGQDNWVDQPGQGQAPVGLDASTVNGTKVVRHLPTTAFNQSAFITRVNDSAFSFVPFTGTESNAVIQFEATGEHVALFALGHDRNGDGLLRDIDREIGPAFGVYDRKFRIQEANLGTAHDDGFNEGGGDGNSGNDWYRLRLLIDFTAAEGEGSGSLFFMNLTDRDTRFRIARELQNIPLGLSRLHADASPAKWDAMWLHLLTQGSNVPSADNLVPNVCGLAIQTIAIDKHNVVLTWHGGSAPYQVQRRFDLTSGNWANVGEPTDSTTATIEMTGQTGFFRVQGQPSN